jgi:hypothetical protein
VAQCFRTPVALALLASALHPAPEPRRIAPIWWNKQGIFMPSTTHVVNDLPARARLRPARCWLAGLVVLAACGGMDSGGPDAPPPCVPPPAGSAPTYTMLYTTYFAPKTPGHCATSDCHLDGVQGWTCGLSKNTCYQGMVDIGLINKNVPTASLIADPKRSLVSWINPNGTMPQDTPGPFPEGRDAILAWVAACAQND